MSDYVLKHDFGYGKDLEQKEINKLNLRNYDDLTTYVDEVISMFDAKVKNRVVAFDNSKTQIILEKI